MVFHRAARREQFGELVCAVYDPVPGPTQLSVVLCHGYGAPANDLVPLAWEIVARSPQLEQSVQFVFPAAPLLLDDTGMMPGRAWWNLDVNALLMAVAAGQVDIIRRSVPEGLAEARRKLNSALHHIQEHWKLKPSQLVLGGFSQGAMLATDVALRMTGGPAALAIFSGTLICEEEWRQLARKKTGLRVLQSHGRYDTILPFVAATWLRDLFAENGLDVDFIEFPGDHTIPRVALDRFAELLTSLVRASG